MAGIKCKKCRIYTLLLLSIVLLIGTVFGASATNPSTTNAFAADPFKNMGELTMIVSLLALLTS